MRRDWASMSRKRLRPTASSTVRTRARCKTSANRRFSGRTDLVLLEIDRTKLACEVIDENLEGGTDLFPHIYGCLPMSAVVRIHPFPCGADGRFDLPDPPDSSG